MDSTVRPYRVSLHVPGLSAHFHAVRPDPRGREVVRRLPFVPLLSTRFVVGSFGLADPLLHLAASDGLAPIVRSADARGLPSLAAVRPVHLAVSVPACDPLILGSAPKLSSRGLVHRRARAWGPTFLSWGSRSHAPRGAWTGRSSLRRPSPSGPAFAFPFVELPLVAGSVCVHSGSPAPDRSGSGSPPVEGCHTPDLVPTSWFLTTSPAFSAPGSRASPPAADHGIHRVSRRPPPTVSP
jgi:hypothetical protein